MALVVVVVLVALSGDGRYTFGDGWYTFGDGGCCVMVV